MKKASRLINYRPLFYGFIAIALGIFFARHFLLGNTLIIVAVSCAFFALLIVCIFTKHIKRIFAGIMAFAIGIGVFALSNYTFNNTPFENGVYTVSGRVNTVANYASSQAVILDNVYIDGQKIDKTVKVFVGSSNSLEAGYVITFTDYLEKTTLFTLGEFNNYEYKYQIAYSASTTNVTVDRFDGLTVSESLRESVKNVLFKNLGNDEASVCYASLFGDKTLISGNIKQDFAGSGLAHLLAVSGLHVGFVALLLSFLLRKLPNKLVTRPLVMAPILFFYCYLCSFSASVVRASIMFLTLALSKAFGKQYDRLNGLGFAGFAVLLYKPLSVYDPGFLLSFFCVFSICIFLPHFTKLFKKIKKLPKWLSESLALILSVQVGMLPLTIYYYGQTTILAILANFVCVPVFELFFMLLVMALPIVLILPALGFVLLAPGAVISGVMLIAKWTASQTWAVVYLAWIPVILIVAVYIIMFVMSHFTDLKITHKIGYSALILAFVVILAIGNSLPTKQNLGVTVLNSYGDCSYVLELGGAKYFVSEYDYYSSQNASVYFSSLVHDNAECLFYMDGRQVYDVEFFKNTYSAGFTEDKNVLAYNKLYYFKNITVSAVSIDLSLCGYMFDYDGYKIFVCHKNADKYHVLSALNDVKGVDILICSSDIISDDVLFDAKYILSDGTNITNGNEINNTLIGNWTLNIENDKLSMRCIDWTLKNYKTKNN